MKEVDLPEFVGPIIAIIEQGLIKWDLKFLSSGKIPLPFSVLSVQLVILSLNSFSYNL